MLSDSPFHVCQLPQETKCDYNSECPGSQVCGVDGQCRDECTSDRDCVAPQQCATGTCAESAELHAGALTPVDMPDAAADGQPCQYNSQCPAGLVCRSGMCLAECLTDVDCAVGSTCVSSRCVAPNITSGVTGAAAASGEGSDAGSIAPTHCANGEQDGTETDVDCGGGQCPPCAAGNGCSAGGDCASGNCAASACQAATCTDGLVNGHETDVDCGGSDCAACAKSAVCRLGTDCVSGLCVGGHCHALDCTDGRVDNAETDVDCGGDTCAACDNHKSCLVAKDCVSGLCLASTCQGAGCANGSTDGTETDVDCGGASCAPCPASEGCAVAGDCVTGVCKNHVCQAPTCADGIINGSETDTDCGGGSCAKCAESSKCVHGSDCASNACVSGVCKPTFALTVALAGGGVGTVTSTPSGIDCGSTCNASFPAATGVSLTATAGLNSVFSGWTGAGCSGSGSCIATMNSAQTVTATFAPSATGAVNWVKTLTASSTAVGGTVAFDGSGNVLNTGTFSGVVDFGAGPITGGSNVDSYVAKYSSTGTYVWARHFGGGYGSSINSVTAAANGDVYIAGVASGPLALGDTVPTNCVSSSTYNQGFVAKYGGATGTFLWARCLGLTGFGNTATGVAVAANGEVVLTGSFDGSIDFGGTMLTGTGNGDVFIARYAADGSLIKVVGYGGSGAENALGIALDPSGNIILGGYVAGSVTLGGATIGMVAGGNDAFVAKYSSAGVFQWSKVMGDTGSDVIYRVGTDAQGNIGYAGYFHGQIDAGGGPLTSVSGTDILVGKYSTSGAYQWAKRFGGAGDDVGDAVGLLPNGDVVFAGYISSSLNFGGGAVAAPGAIDIFVAKLASADGAYVWSNSYGSPQADNANGVAVSAAGSVLLTGAVSGPVDYGTGAAQPFTGTNSAFLLKLTP